MTIYYQYALDDLKDLGYDELVEKENKEFKKELKKWFSAESIFYIAYSVDIIAQDI